ncbi:hypothetical protein [Prevotella sp. 10(H)]|uniref:hypothetical protein n=1 Tax=Prevotella sp. 10(H) TaxID=1158294 RepID=UPI0004A724AD|nr:hypothetical protein [Prevotella sp. 10(H)]
MNNKLKNIPNAICFVLAIIWIIYAVVFAPDIYTEKHWTIHSVFLLIFIVNIIFIFSNYKFEKEELRKNNDLARKIKEDQAKEENRDNEQKRKMKLEEKLDELKDREIARKIRLEKDTFSEK